MPIFTPNLGILPPSQLELWPELAATPPHFTMYGGTALALRLGHRTSVDFDFFSAQSFDPERLANAVPIYPLCLRPAQSYMGARSIR